jgi:hypothetical protein
MENQSSRILSFEEFVNTKDEMPASAATSEVPAEMPAVDGDPAGDAPVETDMELVDGPAAPIEPSGDGEEASADLPVEGSEEAPAEENQ